MARHAHHDDDKFWTRLRHDDDDDNDGIEAKNQPISTTPTARCGFSWHIATCLGLVAVLYAQTINDDDDDDDDNHDKDYALYRQAGQLLTVTCTALLALFVATPMIYFVVNSTTVVTTG